MSKPPVGRAPRTCRAALAITAFLRLAHPAASQPAVSQPPAAVAATVHVLALPVPERVGRYVRGERTDYGSPAGGVGYVFAAPDDSGRTRVNAFFYEREPEHRDQSAADALAGDVAAFREVLEIERQRGAVQAYRVAFEAPDTVQLGSTRGAVPGTRVAVAIRRGGRAFLSWLFLYAVGDGFVKVRATLPVEEWKKSDVAQFARGLVQAALANAAPGGR